ncbi:MAG: hypothetical protein U0793_11470 [Gemmataceae bacterium]
MRATRLKTWTATILPLAVLLGLHWDADSLAAKPKKKGPFNIVVPKIGADPTIKYDYDIVYVRTPRKDNRPHSSRWADASLPLNVDAGGDLMLLHPDGSEERLVEGGKGSVTDPFVSFDGQWVFYTLFEDLKDRKGQVGGPADIYKIHVKSRKVVRLTHGEFTPNTGAAKWAKDFRAPEPGKTTQPYPICNLGPCPLPGKVMFTSNRNGFEMPRGNNMGFNIPFQLFVMDDDGSNVEMIGHLNIGSALHPVPLKDGRVMFSSLEDQGFRNDLDWGIWSIHPDGTSWGPLVSAFGGSAFHFETQLSDESIVVEFYYGGKNEGFGTFVKLPARAPTGYAAFGPAYRNDPRNGESIADISNHGFRPYGFEWLTRFAHGGDWPALSSIPGKDDAPRMGRVTHPSGAPDNHLLCTYSPGNAHFHSAHTVKWAGETLLDAGIYLIKDGKAVDEPAEMFLIKNDPAYHEQWPRALVPYQRIYGVPEPHALKTLANDGKLSPHLPEGTPFGLVGTSSFYKRESFPNGIVRPGEVTATWPGKGKVPYRNWEEGNWGSQGADAGLYANEDIHAVRILAMEPTTSRRNGPKAGRLFYNHARERLRILAEIPVRHFSKDGQPLDPDGNPDTSFLAKIPADTPFTFQTLDKNGMVLNMAQTWHQVRPGEIRNDCGGCHAHSQKPTPFSETAAAKPGYEIFDAVTHTPLLTTKKGDESGKRWDVKDETGLRFVKGVKDVEFHRDVKPILDRSCVACHTHKAEKPAGNLVLDDNVLRRDHISHSVPGTYYRLASDPRGLFGHKLPGQSGWGEGMRKSRYIWAFQSRRSLLIWKIFGARLDGFSNDDHPMEAVPGDPSTLVFKGEPFKPGPENRIRPDVGYTGDIMPPPEAVAGTYVGPDGHKIKVAPLTAEDKLTLVRWIDLGCPIDLDYDPAHPEDRGYGWMLDDTRPTLALTYPKAGANQPLRRILIGMHDYYTGLDMDTFQVVADFAVDGAAAGENLAPRFKAKSPGVWEWTLTAPLTELAKGKLRVSVCDRQGNVTRIERTFTVGKAGAD